MLLKIELSYILHAYYSLVIDTSYLYSLQNEPGAPSLRDISLQVFGIKLPDRHDSVQDAMASLRAAAYIAQNGSHPPIHRTRNESEASSLFFHKIPDYCTEEHIHQMVVESTHILPASISNITRGATRDAGKTTVRFSSTKHADLAFESFAGPVRHEKSNREQKRIYLKGGGYICVRKF